METTIYRKQPSDRMGLDGYETREFHSWQSHDIGAYTYIMAAQGVTIEDDVQIGSHCSIYSVNSIDGVQGSVIIKKGARIGTHTTIMPGSFIGEGAVVGAHSFVKGDIPAGELWYGIPATFRRKL